MLVVLHIIFLVSYWRNNICLLSIIHSVCLFIVPSYRYVNVYYRNYYLYANCRQYNQLSRTTFRKMSEDFVDQCCDKAINFIQSGDYGNAAKFLKKVTDRDPSNQRALELLTILAAKQRAQNPGIAIVRLIT